MADQTLLHEPVVLHIDAGPIAAMVTMPAGEASSLGMVFCPPGGYTISAQRNRWVARLAEQLAERGIPTIRFDYRGIGDSAGDLEQFDQATPLIEEAHAAIAELRSRGVTAFALAGQCFGGRTALATAAGESATKGVFAVSPPVRDIARGEGNASRMAHEASVSDYAKKAASVFDVKALRDPAVRKRYARMAKLFLSARLNKLGRALKIAKHDPTPWVSRHMISHLGSLAGYGAEIEFIYGDDEDDSTDFLEAKAGSLGPALEQAGVVGTVVAGRVHNLGSVAIQDDVIERIVRFTEQLDAD